ncbi:hypothetical protein LV779_26270 [Streptomyces thinghirensis]|nr:hypothetical protein [Streptomyces thinghirensis]
METVDIGVPLRTVYDHWTQLGTSVASPRAFAALSTNDEVTSDWNVKVSPSSRSWKATVQEPWVPDSGQIVWTSRERQGQYRRERSFHGPQRPGSPGSSWSSSTTRRASSRDRQPLRHPGGCGLI